MIDSICLVHLAEIVLLSRAPVNHLRHMPPCVSLEYYHYHQKLLCSEQDENKQILLPDSDFLFIIPSTTVIKALDKKGAFGNN